jgi:hypothetical protein
MVTFPAPRPIAESQKSPATPHDEMWVARRRQELARQRDPFFRERPAARPEWVAFPLNPHCWTENAARLDVIRAIKEVLPFFSPPADPLAWNKVSELVRSTGRSVEECAAMSWDELLMVLEIHKESLRSLLHGRHPEEGSLSKTSHSAGSAMTGSGRQATAAAHQKAARNGTVDDRLRVFAVAHPTEAISLSLSELGSRIGCTKSAFSRSPFYNDGLKERREGRTKKGTGAECSGAEERQSLRNHAASGDAIEAIDRKLDAEMASRSRR